MTILALVMAIHLPAAAAMQEPPDVKKLFEAGQYQEVVEAVSSREDQGDAAPDLVYLAGQSFLKLDESDRANEQFGRLSGRSEDDPWRYIGKSAQAQTAGETEDALAAANRAVALNARHVYAQYQLGLVYSARNDMPKAAAAFEKATTIQPSFAYAQYYAGLSYYKAKRVDKMAGFFETFLKLAPNSPERPAVESIMRTLRGR
jgi:tetratricopeptide (TPR) repeat protein